MSEEKQPAPDRLTVVEQVYHQPFGEEATCISSRFSRHLKTQEQIYQRFRRTATEEWQELDFGWIIKVGMVTIQNEVGKGLQAIPTDAEKEAMAKQVLEITFGNLVALLLIPPGESIRFIPVSANLSIRCQSGKAKFSYSVIPG